VGGLFIYDIRDIHDIHDIREGNGAT